MIVTLLTALTMIAFAANSLLCRMALGGGLIDPVSFTTLRLASGALMLIPVSRMIRETSGSPLNAKSWISGAALFTYAMAFSLAYISLSAGMGALILFGAVQVTMFAAALRAGESLGSRQWFGSLTALGGLVYLVLPGITAPDPVGAGLMFISGIAWGIYSIRGRRVNAPAALTARNFLLATPLALVVSAGAFTQVQWETAGLTLAILSGAVASALGYILWYRVLRSLTTVQASLAQLLVPSIAAFGGAMFLSERITIRLIAASFLILGGVAMATFRRESKPAQKA